MSKRTSNKKGNRLRDGVARQARADQPCRVRAASSYRYSTLGAQDKWTALIRRSMTGAVLQRIG